MKFHEWFMMNKWWINGEHPTTEYPKPHLLRRICERNLQGFRVSQLGWGLMMPDEGPFGIGDSLVKSSIYVNNMAQVRPTNPNQSLEIGWRDSWFLLPASISNTAPKPLVWDKTCVPIWWNFTRSGERDNGTTLPPCLIRNGRKDALIVILKTGGMLERF